MKQLAQRELQEKQSAQRGLLEKQLAHEESITHLMKNQLPTTHLMKNQSPKVLGNKQRSRWDIFQNLIWKKCYKSGAAFTSWRTRSNLEKIMCSLIKYYRIDWATLYIAYFNSTMLVLLDIIIIGLFGQRCIFNEKDTFTVLRIYFKSKSFMFIVSFYIFSPFMFAVSF